MSQASAPVANGYKAFGGTTAQWAASDDRLKYREMGVEYTPGGLVLIKFGIKTEGDVGTPWSELPYSSGPAGPSPAVEWDGPRLRVKNTDGTWTGWVNLQGPSVDYMWTGTSLKLKNPDGTWGDPVDLRGEPGPTGTSVPSTPSSLGGVMPRTGLSVDPDGYLDQDLTWSNRQCYRTPNEDGFISPGGNVAAGLVNGAIIKGSQCTHGSPMSSSNYGKGYALGIDASKSNDVYGAASTVMPPSVNVPMILYLGRPR